MDVIKTTVSLTVSEDVIETTMSYNVWKIDETIVSYNVWEIGKTIAISYNVLDIKCGSRNIIGRMCCAEMP